MSDIRRVGGVLVLALAAALPSLEAQQRGDSDHEWCDEGGWGNRGADRYCEVREFTLQASGALISVDGGGNGGIDVGGWDRNEIHVVAKVQTWDRRGDYAEELAGEIDIETGRVIEARGPRRDRDEGWAVSYRLMVPRNSDLSLETVNGGIGISEVSGDIDFSATNGGIELVAIGGDVRGNTTNGGVNIELEGDQWDGRGLDVETTNGGVTVLIPEDYRAELETGTVNGGFRIDFPIMVQGRINRRRITTELNGGGPPIRIVTTNGGVEILRR